MTPRIAPLLTPDSTPERALPAGTRLVEYEIEGLIAEGSLGLVYRAYDRVLKLHVAIHEYLPDALARRGEETEVVLREPGHAHGFERGRRAFVDEARVLAHCQHPALPRVLRILQHHGTACRVMHCIEGPTLAEHRRSSAGAPDAAALRAWLDSLLGALEELHGHAFVHGAVAPDKILMVPGRGPVLMSSDAVRAALLSGSTRSMMASLEPGWLPIEQREPSPERPRGPWTDLYALAATLHFHIGGQAPAALAEDTPARFEPLGALWQRLHGGPAVAPASLGVLDACLAERPQDRPQSVAELRSLLEAQDAASRLQRAGTAGAWAMAHEAPLRPVGDLQQSLPFVAARAHAVAAAASAAAPAATPPPRRRRWTTGVALMVMLTVSVAAAAWMRNRQGGAPVAAAVAPAALSSLPAPRPAPPAPRSAPPVPLSSLPAPRPPPPAPLSVPPATAAPAPAGAARPETRADATPAETPAPAPPAPVAQGEVRTPDSPRSRCGARAGYALYQCMQTQCAKRNWAQHAQCRRLREQQSLG